jgi:hypothetical protein
VFIRFELSFFVPEPICPPLTNAKFQEGRRKPNRGSDGRGTGSGGAGSEIRDQARMATKRLENARKEKGGVERLVTDPVKVSSSAKPSFLCAFCAFSWLTALSGLMHPRRLGGSHNDAEA